jgi:hypothetical protein
MKRLLTVVVCFITIAAIGISNVNAKANTTYYGFYGSVCTVFKKRGNKLTVKTQKGYPIEYYKKNRLFTAKNVGTNKTFKLNKKTKYYSASVDNHMRLYDPGTVKKVSMKKIKKYWKESRNDEYEIYPIVVVKNGVATKVVCCFS